MKFIYDFFNGKENITDDDIEDYEAHADMMQKRELAEMDRIYQLNNERDMEEEMTELPDKTKLLNFADLINVFTSGNLTLKSNEAKKIYGDTILTIVQVEEHLRKKIEEL